MKVVVISLRERQDLRDLLQDFKQACDHRNFEFEFYISERDGEEIISDMLRNRLVSWLGNSFRNTKKALVGELGCFKTHLDIWEMCKNDNQDYLIVEDSTSIDIEDFNNEKFDSTCDITYYNQEHSYINGMVTGFAISAYKISPQSASHLLKVCLPMVYPLDLYLMTLYSAGIVTSMIGNQFAQRNNKVAHSTEKNRENLNNRQSMVRMINRINELGLE